MILGRVDNFINRDVVRPLDGTRSIGAVEDQAQQGVAQPNDISRGKARPTHNHSIDGSRLSLREIVQVHAVREDLDAGVTARNESIFLGQDEVRVHATTEDSGTVG